MAVFNKNELDEFRALTSNSPVNLGGQPQQQAPQKKGGLGGFLTSLISEGGALGGGIQGAAMGSALGPLGTLAGGAIGAGLGGFLGRLGENQVRDRRWGLGDAAKEGAVSAVFGASPIKALKGASAAGKVALEGGGKALAKEAAEEAVTKPGFIGKLLGKGEQALTKEASGLKVGANVGDIERLGSQTDFMSKYVGTPKKQLQLMAQDMKSLGKEVDDILSKTPIEVRGGAVGERLQQAASDLTDPRFLDIDLNNPSVQKYIGRYGDKFAQATNAKDVNDIIKTLNPVAERAQKKLFSTAGSPLTAQESAALALKRAGDDVLKDIPEIAPLKKQMAQIFELNPQVAKTAEKSIGVPFVRGLEAKTPIQAIKGAQSYAGAGLRAATEGGATPKGVAARILAAQAAQGLSNAQPLEEQQQPDVNALPEQTNPYAMGDQTPAQDVSSPFSPANVEANVQSILAQGGDFNDVAKYLDVVKTMQSFSGTGGGNLNSTASGVIADTKTGLQALADLYGSIEQSGANNPLVGRIRGANPFDTEAQGLRGDIATAKQIVGKALEGGVLRKEDEIKYSKLLPTMGDTDATAKNKISKLINLISGRLNEYQANIGAGSGGTDLATLGIQGSDNYAY